MITTLGTAETVQNINDKEHYSVRVLSQRTHANTLKLLRKLGIIKNMPRSGAKSFIATNKGTLWLGDYVIYNEDANEFIEFVDQSVFDVRYCRMEM